MTPTTALFLDQLKQAAAQADSAEAIIRREMALKIRNVEQERAFAFRRLNLIRAVFDAIAGAESEEIAVATALAALRVKLGWSDDSEPRTEALSRFSPVAVAMFHAMSPPEEKEKGEKKLPPDPAEALRAFENWYAQSRDHSFWILFEHYLPETPRVDF